MNDLRKLLPVPCVALLLLIVTALPAGADELIRFKSGYEMMVVSHKVEGDMVIVTLAGGGEVGFPKNTIDLLEGGKVGDRSGRRTSYNRVPPRARPLERFRTDADEAPSRFIARGTATEKGVTIGYSFGGAPQQRFNGGAAGPSVGTKIGSSLKSFRAEAKGQGPVVPGKEGIKTVKAIIIKNDEKSR